MSGIIRNSIVIACVFVVPAFADTVSVGYLSLLSDSPVSGLQELTVNNLTGNVNCQAYGAPYEACSNLDFTGWTLTVDYLSDYYNPSPGSFIYSDGVGGYGDIAPGSASVFDFDLCADQLTCADAGSPATQITSVEFSGQISSPSFCLYDATVPGCNASSPETFFANPNFDLVWNSNSATGGPYVDEANSPYAQSPDIMVADQGSGSMPEPSTFFLLTSLLPFLAQLVGSTREVDAARSRPDSRLL